MPRPIEEGHRRLIKVSILGILDRLVDFCSTKGVVYGLILVALLAVLLAEYSLVVGFHLTGAMIDLIMESQYDF